MERFSQRESVLLGYSLQRTLMMNSGSSPKTTPFRNSDVDFHDVFGGPPRRFSMQEVRHSFNDVNDSNIASKGNDEEWSGLGEKPVFGDEGLNRRRYQSADFFDDIFGGDVSANSTPKRHGRDYVFPTSPSSRVLSPLPPKADEPFASSSLLSQFSLPAKVNKGAELPTFGSAARSPYKHKDGSSNGISYSYSSGTSLSRFSSEAIQGFESKNDIRSSHEQSPLSEEVPHTISEVSSNLTAESDKTGTGSNLKKDSESSENSTNSSSHFHFSIYKWAGKGVPLDLPIRSGKSSSTRSKETAKSEPFSGNSEGIDKEDGMESQSSKTPLPDSSSKNEPNKLENDLPLHEAKEEKVKPSQVSVPQSEPQKLEVKSIRSLLFDDHLERGSVEATKMGGQKERILTKSTKDSTSSVIGFTKTAKKQERNNVSMSSSEVDKVSAPQCSPRNPRESNGRSRVKGKVREFVRMFNQEASPNPKDGLKFRSQSCKWNKKCVFEDEPSNNTNKTDEKLQMDEDLKQSTKVHAFGQVNQASKNTGSYPVGSKSVVEETDESFHETFQIKVLPQDENELLGAGTKNQEIQDIDAKIRQWTKGKEGNIRSLLSTLQYVLWPESGWKAVPLVDIIEGNAVKRAYQKALLCLHPDKLQQKGAASYQKYIAEKVFDILQVFLPREKIIIAVTCFRFSCIWCRKYLGRGTSVASGAGSIWDMA
ncbi:J domain-containing protein required for chloroplast accumulation response 1 [Morus notabilis]|uniref:J domain-containing protein required for chloroplast accumulation response 1 n=1 Tax=Morus notabilis TaxID=981085 RepID=UPI000CED0EA2|nr:J domain-containing protein required for chloroplast accumulation response 1 [Morus notabilis]